MAKRRSTLAFLAIVLSVGVGLAFGSSAFAQTVDPTSGLSAFAEAAGFTSQGNLVVTIARLIRTAISFLGILAVLFMLYGGFLFMTAGGNEDKLKRARGIFVSAIIGLVIILSAFSIAQFVLSRLTSSLGGGISSDGEAADGTYSDGGGTSGQFLLTSVNTECAESIKNLQLQFTFNANVDSGSVDAGGISVESYGTEIDGSFAVSGKRVTFTPSAVCEENPDEHCFPAGRDHEIFIDPTVLKSTLGRNVECTDAYPCSFEFTTGDAVDASGPTIEMDAPDQGASVYLNDVELLQAIATDDTGVSSLDFSVNGEVVYQAALFTDSTEESLAPSNYFFTDGTQWDTAGFTTGSYSIRAEGADCAGHSDSSSSVTVVLRAAHCGNGYQDEDEYAGPYGEGDCGGADCGSCDEMSCDSDDDCSSGTCDEANNECVGVPKIESVSPGDGAVGNLITISGENFGATADSVTFLGDETTTADDVVVSAYACNGSVRWSDEEIVVQVDDSMVDGPILVETADGYGDQTNDDYGPTISDFQINGIVRPGICMLDPNSDVGNSQADVIGNNFGSSQGTSTVYFANYEASDYDSWSDGSLSVVVPLLNARDYQTQVWAGDYQCAHADGSLAGVSCSDDSDCDAEDGQSCATMHCSDSDEICEEDDDCAGVNESCVSLRQGSNEVTFTVVDASTGEVPAISQVVSGWEACSTDNARCGEDGDCASGTCDGADNWGPPGQYVTVYGSSFGSSTGTIVFTDDTGYAIGDVEFPEACGDDAWDDGEITVKVPSTYASVDANGDGRGDAIEPGTFALTVKTSRGAESEGTEFVILNDDPGPGICRMDPSSGPAGTTIPTIDGEYFGGEQGAGFVEFYDGKRVTGANYWNDGQIKVVVDANAQTGPAFVVTDEGYESNTVDFEVGDCRENASLCGAGTQCCGDGSCSASCDQGVPTSHYAWTFSTGDIPATPRVSVFCGDRDEDGNYDGVSPGPWENWSEPSDVCVNASVTATFTEAMDANSFEGHVRVQACDGADAESPCANLDDDDAANDASLGGSVVSTDEYKFEWDPTENFPPSTTYRVTLEADGIKSAAGAFMSRDYSWEFTTSSSTDLCEVGNVYVSPSAYTAIEENEEVDYSASPISAEDDCVPLQCASYDWNWDASDTSKADLIGDDLGNDHACENVARALAQTNVGTPVEIEAGPDGVRNNPTDTGDLTVNFTDPEVTGWEPSCETACLNAGLRATFNTPMTSADFAAGDTVVLYACEDSLCDGDEVTEFSGTYAVLYSDSDDAHALSISHDDLNASAWYRVVISGGVESYSGIALSESGSNAGTDDNRYFPDDFSWTFKTKSSDVPCSIDRIEMVPSEARATHIGEQTAFEALPYGAPDDCSASGQLLDGADYDWDSWTASDDPNVTGTSADVAEMVESGLLRLSYNLQDGCSSSCLNTGASVTIDDPVCGDGHVTYGEECDGGADCTDECLNEGNDLACTDTVTLGCCGNGALDAGEECDDGNSSSGDGCSSICLNNGARKAGTTCGDGITDQSASTGGEDYDDGNSANGDGVSSDCLYEGGESVEGVFATCGNGDVEDGEDCDDGDADDGDGCSSECLFEGADVCAYECVGGDDSGENCSGVGADCGTGTCEAVVTPCCGDRVTDYGLDGRNDAEDCDDGNANDNDGCSSECLNEGASVSYDAASYCGDGDVGTGEECEAGSAADYNVGSHGVSVIKNTAPQDVINGVAGAEIVASSGSETGTAALSLSCSCNSDDSCGDESLYGCGTSSCCFPRPAVSARYPAGGTDVCLNTAIFADFTGLMDENSFDPSGNLTNPNLYLELVTLGGTSVDSSNCPEAYTDAQLAFSDRVSDSWLGRAWDWIVGSVRSLFGRPATAATYACVAPVTYAQAAIDGGARVSLNLSNLLEANSTYRFVILEDSNASDAIDEGVLSANAVGVVGPSDGMDDVSFTTGGEVCELESVVVEDLGLTAALSNELLDPSVAYFTEDGEAHTVMATAYTVRGGSLDAIGEIPSVYEWTWGWGSTVCDDETDAACAENVIDMATADSVSSIATAEGNTGREVLVATASFASTNSFGDASGGVSGEVEVTANVCDNPPTIGFPYVDTISNFGFFYCRDAGDADLTADDLPELDAPVDVVSYTADIIQELIFKVSGTSDAIGVRVLKNDSYFPPDLWYEAQGFTGSPSSDELDGYEAVRDGNTLYVAAANHSSSGSSDLIYPNIYAISYTEDAGDEAQQIFDQILANWSFNANDDVVTDVNVCASGGAYASDATTGDLVTCEWDADCVSLGSGYVCDALKAELTRDMRRLTDVSRVVGLLEAYGEESGLCSVTTNQACAADSECPGIETCEPSVPALASGTFVRSYATSAWPSWSAELGNALGVALPEDPINEFYACGAEGYESDTCWNASSATFQCPDGSHVYGYQSVGGASFNAYAQLEYAGGAWAYDLTSTLGQTVIEQDWAGSSALLADGFVATPTFCKAGATYGESAVCGDGIVGSGEGCEIGQTDGKECDSDGNGVADGTGTITVTCDDECADYQSAYEAETAGGTCVAYACGNGVVETDTGEECDDGSFNGTYGHCGDDCTLATAFSCGDGYLAGGEQCDCGEVSNFSSLGADSWAVINACLTSNGQWNLEPAGTCAYDCTAPGPSCGDKEVNGTEECDGGYEQWVGGFCADGTTCSTDADCDDGSTCGSGDAACGTGAVCVGGSDEGKKCDDASLTDGDGVDDDDDCDSGACSDFTYELTRTRTCASSGTLMCTWDAWTSCVSASQYCGNGTVEGNEECDDGNEENTDACTNACTQNVCGDDYVYAGVESCDGGADNGTECTAAYGGTCNFCSTSCTYQARSGAYCGDGVIEGTEYCDGSEVPYFCFDNASAALDRGQSCDPADENTDEGCDSGYTCRWMGVCNGGSKQGQQCTLNPNTGNSYSTDEAADKNGCGSGECVAPTCADDCSGMCPYGYQTASLLAQVAEAGSSAEESVELYDYLSGSGSENATILLPACSVATQISANVDTDDVIPPSVAVVFVTDLSNSMGWNVSGDDTTPDVGARRIDYVVDALTSGIGSLFDADVAEMAIAHLGFSGAGDTGTSSSYDASAGSPGYYIDYSSVGDSYLLGSSYEEDLLAAAELYRTDPGGTGTSARPPQYLLQWTPTYMGIEAGVDILDGSSADVKVLVLLSDGNLTHDKDWTYCSGADALSSCVAQIRTDLVTASANSDIQFYAAAITGDDTEAGYIAHLSSDECGSTYSSESDCDGNYFYRAETADEIATMYEEIISSILNLSFTLTTEVSGAAQTTTGSVGEGRNQVLPFPDNFECTGSEMAIPFFVNFSGGGFVTVSDMNFTYCPAP